MTSKKTDFMLVLFYLTFSVVVTITKTARLEEVIPLLKIGDAKNETALSNQPGQPVESWYNNYTDSQGSIHNNTYQNSVTLNNTELSSTVLHQGGVDSDRNFKTDFINGTEAEENSDHNVTLHYTLFAYKGCPEGERKDYAGKCRTINVN